MRIKESEIKNIIRDSIQEEMQNLKEAEKYRQFFRKSLEKAGEILGKEVDSPENLTDDEKRAFFNYIDKMWDEDAGEIDDSVDTSLKDMFGESMIRSRIRKEIQSYLS